MSNAQQNRAESQRNPWQATEIPEMDEDEYVRRVLDRYRQTPTTVGKVRPADRRLAVELYRSHVPIALIEGSFALAAVRRIFRDSKFPPLAPIRSLHYFLPLMDEIRSYPIDPEYIKIQQWKLNHLHEYADLLRDPLD